IVKAQNKRIDQLIKHVTEGSKKEEEREPQSTIQNMNPYLECLNPDVLYHLGMSTDTTDFPKVFGDVRFVVMGGTAQRMEQFANTIMGDIGLKMSSGVQLKNMSEQAKRYAMYKVGPVLCVSHGIGGPSISIVLHEVIKIMHYAKCQDPVFFRIGTSGGIGIEPGTVVVTKEAVDGQLRPSHEVVVHTSPQLRSTKLNEELVDELISISNECRDCYKTVSGKTLCANDFYEGQSRLDGAFCDYGPDQKKSFLKKIAGEGVVNMEMESTAFAALTNQAGIKSAVICVTLLDRQEGDQVCTLCAMYVLGFHLFSPGSNSQINVPPEKLKEWEGRPQALVARYMKKVMYGDEDDEGSEECNCPAAQADKEAACKAAEEEQS
ncbi:hypothetical protein KR222_002130, partial [Zaprionus bogoriensis]